MPEDPTACDTVEREIWCLVNTVQSVSEVLIEHLWGLIGNSVNPFNSTLFLIVAKINLYQSIQRHTSLTDSL